MDSIEYEGKLYVRYNSKWSKGVEIVSESMQKKLNAAFASKLDINLMTCDELKINGEKYQESGDYSRAILHFEKMKEKFHDSYKTYGILARLSSCYRCINKPRKAIEFFEEYRQDKDAISSQLLTSVAAAYCDIRDAVTAKKYANRAFAMSGGKADGELHKVYARIKSMESSME